MSDLGPTEIELLSALRTSDEPDLADRERIRRRVWLAVGLTAVGTSGVGVGTQAAVAATPKFGLLAATTTKVGIVVALATGGAVFATQPWSATDQGNASPSAGVSQVSNGERVVAVPQPSVDEGVSEATVLPQVKSAPAAAARARSKSETAVGAASSGADLDAEIQLLRQARQALTAGQFTHALASLNEHARRFPRGVLASERRASIAIALCRSGQINAGKAHASRYLARNPYSPLADRVRAGCKLE